MKNFAAASAILFATLPAKADSFDIGEVFNGAVDILQQGIDFIWPDEMGLKGVTARVGFGLGFTPDYIGSDNYALRVVPLLDIRYKDNWRLNGSKLTFSAVRTKNFEAGPLVNLRFGRSESSNDSLTGLGDINTTLELGAYAKYKTKAGYLTTEYRHGIGEGIGSSLQATIGHGIYKSEKFVAVASLRARWLGNKSAQTNFGITQTQAANSLRGFDVFTAKSGISDVTANIIGAYTVNESTRLVALVSYGKLVGDSSDSPLVADAGSSNQLIFGTGLAFSF